jgi:hypothetical protein
MISRSTLMKTRLVLKPGQRGTRQLQEIYGDRLLYVRYRYDAELRLRVKTVELIVDEVAWSPPELSPAGDTLVRVLVATSETQLQQQIAAAGGRYLAAERMWEMRYDQAARLGLTGRIVTA